MQAIKACRYSRWIVLYFGFMQRNNVRREVAVTTDLRSGLNVLVLVLRPDDKGLVEVSNKVEFLTSSGDRNIEEISLRLRDTVQPLTLPPIFLDKVIRKVDNIPLGALFYGRW